MSLDFLPCPKCKRYGLSWDARAKAITCLYHKCRYVVSDVVYEGKIPTLLEFTNAVKKEQSND